MRRRRAVVGSAVIVPGPPPELGRGHEHGPVSGAARVQRVVEDGHRPVELGHDLVVRLALVFVGVEVAVAVNVDHSGLDTGHDQRRSKSKLIGEPGFL